MSAVRSAELALSTHCCLSAVTAESQTCIGHWRRPSKLTQFDLIRSLMDNGGGNNARRAGNRRAFGHRPGAILDPTHKEAV
jgi:hypothetical protein